MLLCNDALLFQSFGRPKERRWNTCLRHPLALLQGLSHGPHSDDLGLQEGTQSSIVFPHHSALVVLPWPSFSKATLVLGTIREGVRHNHFSICSCFLLLILHLRPFSLSLFLGGSLSPAWQFLFSDGISRYHPHQLLQAQRSYSCLCFSWSQPCCHYCCCFFWDTSSCGESSFPVIIALSSNFD